MAENFFSKFNLYGTEIKVKDEVAQAVANRASTTAATANANATAAKSSADSANEKATQTETNLTTTKNEIPVITFSSATSTITIKKGIS